MRVVLVAYQGSIHTCRWASFLALRGHDVHVVTCGSTILANEALPAQGQSSPFSIHDLGTPRLGKIGYFFKLPGARRVIRRLEPDLLHAHYATSYGLLGLVSGARPFVVTAHGDDVLISPRNSLMRHVVAAVLRSADLVTVPGEHMRFAVEALVSKPRNQVAVFQYGVEVRRLIQLAATEEPSRSRAESASLPLRVISARALLKPYRLDILLQALALLESQGIAFHCDVVGDGPRRASLTALASRLGIAESVRFHGQLPSSAVESKMAHSDIYVSLAESDGVSVAMLEAMALGLVPVLVDIPANRPWLRNGSGVLVKAEPASVANGIQRAASLDRAPVAQSNRRMLLREADFQTNLGKWEVIMTSLASRQGASDK